MAKDNVRVTLLSARAGHRFDDTGRVCGMFTQKVGDVVSMTHVEAKRHVDRGMAEYKEDSK